MRPYSIIIIIIMEQPAKTLKFAEVTIIKNVDNSNMINSIQRFFGRDEELIIDKEKDIVLMTFEGEPPFDTKDRYVDLNFVIMLESTYSPRISYMRNKVDNEVYFSINPKINPDGTQILDFCRISKENPSYNQKDFQASCYNNIFYRNVSPDHISPKVKIDALYIVKLNSSTTMPRYVIAYDETLITKLQVIYVIRNVFLRLFDEDS